MIDPKNFVREYLDEELEELFVFSVFAAGKTAKTMITRVEQMKQMCKSKHNNSLFWFIAKNPALQVYLKHLGIGCHSQKTRTLKDAVSKFNNGKTLRKATVQDLESIYGIGPKTARLFYCAHTNSNSYAILDTHLMKFLKANGVQNVPNNTPSGKKYLTLEQEYLKLVPKPFTASEFDNMVWYYYSKK